MPISSKYLFVVSMDVEPDKEALFNEVYDTEHVPNILKVKGVVGVVRFKDAAPNAAGWLVYSALYLLERADLPDTPEWKKASEIGRWAPVMRPKLKSRQRRLGPVVAAELVGAKA